LVLTLIVAAHVMIFAEEDVPDCPEMGSSPARFGRLIIVGRSSFAAFICPRTALRVIGLNHIDQLRLFGSYLDAPTSASARDMHRVGRFNYW